MKRSHLLAAAASFFLTFSSLVAISAGAAPASTRAADTEKQATPAATPAPQATHSAVGDWVYDDAFVAGRQTAPAAASPTIPFETRAVDWQWTASSQAQTGGASHGATLDRFALIALDGADIAGNHDALIFAVLSLLSALICLGRKNSPST